MLWDSVQYFLTHKKCFGLIHKCFTSKWCLYDWKDGCLRFCFFLSVSVWEQGFPNWNRRVPILKHQQIFIYKFCKYVFIAKTKKVEVKHNWNTKKPEEKHKGDGRKMQISEPVLECFRVFFSAPYGKILSGCNLAKINY